MTGQQKPEFVIWISPTHVIEPTDNRNFPFKQLWSISPAKTHDTIDNINADQPWFFCCWNSWTHFVALKYWEQWAGWLLCKDRGCKKYTGSGLCNRAGKKLSNMLHSIPLICQLPPSVALVSSTSFLSESMISATVCWTMSLLSHKTWPGARSRPICQGPYHPTFNFQYPSSANQHLTSLNVRHNAIFSYVGDWMMSLNLEPILITIYLHQETLFKTYQVRYFCLGNIIMMRM